MLTAQQKFISEAPLTEDEQSSSTLCGESSFKPFASQLSDGVTPDSQLTCGIPKSLTIQDFSQVQMSNCPTPVNFETTGNKVSRSSSTECVNKKASECKTESSTFPFKFDSQFEHYANCKCDKCFDVNKRGSQLVPHSLYANNAEEYEQYQADHDDLSVTGEESRFLSQKYLTDLEKICMDVELTAKGLKSPLVDLKGLIRKDHTVMNNDEFLIKESGDQLIIQQKIVEEEEREVTQSPKEAVWVPSNPKAPPGNGKRILSTDAKMYYHRYIMPYQKTNRVDTEQSSQQKQPKESKSRLRLPRSRSKSKSSKAELVKSRSKDEGNESVAASSEASQMRSRTPSVRSEFVGEENDTTGFRDYYNMAKSSAMSKSEQYLYHSYGLISEKDAMGLVMENHYPTLGSNSKRHKKSPLERYENMPDHYTKISPSTVETRDSVYEMGSLDSRDRKAKSRSLKNLFGIRSRDKR